jgi:hypothetical protein
MIFAVIQNDKVINTIIADQNFVDTNYPDSIDITDVDPRPGIGWAYDGKKFIKPVVVPEIDA